MVAVEGMTVVGLVAVRVVATAVHVEVGDSVEAWARGAMGRTARSLRS